MSGWQLVTLLAALFNTGALVYWQRANERRMDAHWERMQNLQAQIKDLAPLLKHVSARLEGTKLGASEWKPEG